jgi:hypothetical protein
MFGFKAYFWDDWVSIEDHIPYLYITVDVLVVAESLFFAVVITYSIPANPRNYKSEAITYCLNG